MLLSDGRDTERFSQLDARPPALKVPVYPVIVGPAEVSDDLWIEAVESPPVAFIRTPVELRVRVGASGNVQGPAELTLIEEGQP